MEKIRAIIKRTDEPFGHVAHISPTLKNLQKYVGGYIEAVPLSEGNVMIVNEEGKLLGLEVNFRTPCDVIVGDVLVVGTSGEEFSDCTLDFKVWKKILEKWGDVMDGQMNIFDFLKPEEPKRGDCASCEWMFWKHTGGRGERSCQYHGGKDGCHYERRKTCRTCEHMQQSVWGLMEYHGFACFGFGTSKSQDINGKACVDYEEATDGEAWRTDDEAVKEWMEYERCYW